MHFSYCLLISSRSTSNEPQYPFFEIMPPTKKKTTRSASQGPANGPGQPSSTATTSLSSKRRGRGHQPGKQEFPGNDGSSHDNDGTRAGPNGSQVSIVAYFGFVAWQHLSVASAGRGTSCHRNQIQASHSCESFSTTRTSTRVSPTIQARLRIGCHICKGIPCI